MTQPPLYSDSDNELAKSAGLTVVDMVATTVDMTLGGLPLTSGAWGLAKALLGRSLALRQKKALEWIEMVRDNPSIFTSKLLETEEFQDAFVISLEGYIKERDSDKRAVLRAIFLDYSAFPKPQSYPLERFNEITKQLTIFDTKKFSYLFYLASEQNPGSSFQDTANDSSNIESVLHLISLGLVIQDTVQATIKEQNGPNTPRVFISGLGTRYYNFIRSSGISYKEPSQP